MGKHADDDRESGIAFGDLEDELAAHSYPATLDELVAAYGDETLELEDGEVTLGAVLEPLLAADGETTYESAEEVKGDVFNLVGRDAVGRAGYSDRGGETPAETDESAAVGRDEEDQSF